MRGSKEMSQEKQAAKEHPRALKKKNQDSATPFGEPVPNIRREKRKRWSTLRPPLLGKKPAARGEGTVGRGKKNAVRNLQN